MLDDIDRRAEGGAERDPERELIEGDTECRAYADADRDPGPGSNPSDLSLSI
jgi:hypothetical protein